MKILYAAAVIVGLVAWGLLVLSPINHCGIVRECFVVRLRIDQIEGSLGLFRHDTGRYPDNSEGLQALISNPGIAGWSGPYFDITDLPRDLWDRTFHYWADENGEQFEVWSLGSDNLPGGTFKAADCSTKECGCELPRLQKMLANLKCWLGSLVLSFLWLPLLFSVGLVVGLLVAWRVEGSIT